MSKSGTNFEQNEVKEIDISEVKNLDFWCKEFNLQANELKEIVQTVGPRVHDVKLHIAKKLLINWPLNIKTTFFKK